MAMQVIYEKDTINHWKKVTEPGVQQIRLFADTLGSMKEIKGFIYYPMDSQEKGGAVLADPLHDDSLSLYGYTCICCTRFFK